MVKIPFQKNSPFLHLYDLLMYSKIQRENPSEQ